ncbi:ATP-grasp domain-containing protein [Amycolatopsis sp. NPDC059657]|uniref:ATP-grasp domain-containing protein n=1 Tax=Amycolatopsis sp. NPDC059657 TaxID=3346899 RepID=UPI0036720729
MLISVCGVPAAEGLDLLRGHAPALTWQDRSPFLGASASIPWLRYAHRDHRGEAEGRPVKPTRCEPGGFAVSFAPEDGTGAHEWAAASGLRLLAPDADAVATAADKVDVLRLFEQAGVETPRSWVVDADSGWPWDGGPLVVQRRVNNLTGKGTRFVTSAGHLADALREWNGETVRIAEYVEGVPVTVSGCATPWGTVVSALSHQLVGIPALTSYWGAHCGNQLIADDDLPAGAAARCGAVCAAVGDRLGELGYRGAFGLDLMVTPAGAVLPIEVNPRFQTVVSLVQAQERAAGLLPSLGTHVLASLLMSAPVERVRTRSLPLSQLVVMSDRSGVLRETVASGRYRLDNGRLFPAGQGDLLTLMPGEALLWAHAHPSDRLRPGEELVLIQLPHRAAAVSGRPELTAETQAWVDAVRRTLRVDDA